MSVSFDYNVGNKKSIYEAGFVFRIETSRGKEGVRICFPFLLKSDRLIHLRVEYDLRPILFLLLKMKY